MDDGFAGTRVPGARLARGQYFNCLYVLKMPSAVMAAIRFLILGLTCAIVATHCKANTPELEIRHDLKYIAAFSAPAILTADDERRFQATFQSKYKNRVLLFRPISAQAYLSALGGRAALFAIIRLSALRETKAVTREIEQALGGGSTLALLPLIEAPASQDNFSGQYFYLALEKRTTGFAKLPASQKADLMRIEADELSRDRNLLSYFSANILSDTPYQTVHLMGFSGIAETEYQTIEGLYARAVKKLESHDAVLAEKIR